MLVKLSIVFMLACSTLAMLSDHKLTLPPKNVNGKNFSSLLEAVKDAEDFIVQVKDYFNMPSLVFGISVKGNLVYERAWGYSDLENAVPASMQSKYRLCSISKTFASALVGLLVQEGKLTYDTPINQVLNEKDFPMKTWNNEKVNITVGDLLSHRAGLHITTLEDFNNVVLAKNTTEMIHKYKDETLRHKPGTAFEYSNYGFQVLGAVIEAVTGHTYEHEIERFLLINQMKGIVLDRPDRFVEDRLRYYRFNSIQVPKVNIPTMVFDELFMAEHYWTAGGLLSNKDDLLRYGQMMVDAYKGRSGAILHQTTVKEMWTTRSENVVPSTKVDTGYGYGWFTVNITHPEPSIIKHRNFVFHSGGLVGTTTMLIIYPEEEIVGVAFTNKGNMIGLDQMVIYTVENIYDFL